MTSPIAITRGAVGSKDAGRYLGVSQRQVQKLIRAGRLHGFTPLGLTRKTLITLDELDRFIAASVAESEQVAS